MPDNGWSKRNPVKAKAYRTAWNQRHPDGQRKMQRAYDAKLRAAVIAFLGGVCVRCGFSDARALQIDHVRGGGKRELKGVRRSAYYKSVMADTTGKYQLLCANCNWIKRYDNNELKSPEVVPRIEDDKENR